MFYYNSYWGMNSIWWIVWLFLLFWIFVIPFNIHFQRFKKESPLDILQKQFALGKITKDEYQLRKRLLLGN
jgi:putative membrane protein